MKLGLLQDINWEHVGAVLAREGDDEQATFIRSFLKECRSWGTAMQVEKQLCSINAKLTAEERETLKMLSYTENTP